MGSRSVTHHNEQTLSQRCHFLAYANINAHQKIKNHQLPITCFGAFSQFRGAHMFLDFFPYIFCVFLGEVGMMRISCLDEIFLPNGLRFTLWETNEKGALLHIWWA